MYVEVGDVPSTIIAQMLGHHMFRGECGSAPVSSAPVSRILLPAQRLPACYHCLIETWAELPVKGQRPSHAAYGLAVIQNDRANCCLLPRGRMRTARHWAQQLDRLTTGRPDVWTGMLRSTTVMPLTPLSLGTDDH